MASLAAHPSIDCSVHTRTYFVRINGVNSCKIVMIRRKQLAAGSYRENSKYCHNRELYMYSYTVYYRSLFHLLRSTGILLNLIYMYIMYIFEE